MCVCAFVEVRGKYQMPWNWSYSSGCKHPINMVMETELRISGRVSALNQSHLSALHLIYFQQIDKRKTISWLGMVAHVWSPNIYRRQRQENCFKFEGNLVYVMRPSLKEVKVKLKQNISINNHQGSNCLSMPRRNQDQDLIHFKCPDELNDLPKSGSA